MKRARIVDGTILQKRESERAKNREKEKKQEEEKSKREEER